ncbi:MULTISPECIES: glycosyltransferase family 2 protein [Dyella]|nr:MULTISPECIES: glycosyltransferase family 2 protein [Dyella]
MMRTPDASRGFIACPSLPGSSPAPGMVGSFLIDLGGWLLYVSALIGLVLLLPPQAFEPGTRIFVFALGVLGMWRYSLRAVHFIRSMIFLHWSFPWARRRVRKAGDLGMPPHVYLLVTSFRIDTLTTTKVYQSTFEEAIECGVPTTVVASIVEMGDQRLILALWEYMDPPERVRLKIVRIPGTGKRDALAQGFRAISRDMPEPNAVVAVIDGDTVLEKGVIARTAPFLTTMPSVGALTTNEFCEVAGSYAMSEWHKLRFAQRHLNMCSMALGRRVLTLTGRMSLFRASIVIDPEFIDDVQNDSVEHWRLGRFKFLTGDDKSTWYSLMRMGWDTYYVPDASVRTLETPPDPKFLKASRKLMFRWYGNSLRQNSRALKLGPGKLGWFTYYVLLDQRVLMWTGLLGLAMAIVASIKFSPVYLLTFLLWVGITRLIMSMMLLASGHRIGPAFPVLLYYNQVIGSVMKIFVFFRLDQQSWTRQNTTLDRNLGAFERRFNHWSSWAMTFTATSVFAAIVMCLLSL